jgi:hypothetical protein
MESDKEAIKQAIREVLLSDEFLAAFAAAWQNTPLIHSSEMKLVAGDYTGESFAETAMKNYKSPEIVTSTMENGESK